MYRIASVVLAMLAAPSVLIAQTVIGHTLEATTRTPMRGVFVVLMDDAGRRLSGVLSDENGRFIIRAPTPGTYTLQASHIGYRTARLGKITLQSEQSLTIDVPIEVQALQFQAIEVKGTRRCRLGADAGAETARVWEEVRKALEVAAWVREQAASYRLVTSRRHYDRGQREDGEQELDFMTALAARAFQTAPVDSLLTEGFVFERNEELLYHGPDAELLMSDAFQNTYCFRVTRDDEHPGLIGLAFEPRENRRVVGIIGALWVDEQSGELRFIDYDFTSSRSPGRASDLAGGRTDFTRLPTGAWIVQQWSIRMPRYASAGGGRMALVGSTLQGSEILGIEWPDVDVKTVAVDGVAFDSLAGEPMTGGRVVALGTYLVAAVDSAGHFRFDSIRPGDYYLELEHPSVDALPIAPQPTRIRVAEAGNRSVTLATPSRQTTLTRGCDADDLRNAVRRTGYARSMLGAVSGSVRDAATGRPVRATIMVLWSTPEERRLEQRSREDGTFSICGVPVGVPVMLQVWLNNQLLYSEEPGVLKHGFYRAHIAVGGTKKIMDREGF